MPTDRPHVPEGDGDTRARAWSVRSPPRVGVSTCLLGEPVRFNGKHKRDDFLARVLGPRVEWVPVCPEVETGMGTPREPVHLVTADDGTRMLAAGGADHTHDMRAFAERRVRELDDAGLSGYIFKSKSPSCGLYGLAVYAGERVSHRGGRGLFTEAFVRANPLLAVEEEGRLRDAELREHFVERVFAHARLREVFARGWRQRDLVDFHSRHKLQLMAHDPARAKEAGRVVAAGSPPDRVERDYIHAFLSTLAVRPTPGKHVNALQHALGQLGGCMDAAQRREILRAIAAYRDGRVPLSVPAGLLQRCARSEGQEFMRAQTYFDPFPAELVPRQPPLAAVEAT